MDNNTKNEEYLNSKCPNCGSELKYLPGQMKVKCVSCESTFDIASLGRGKLDDEEQDFQETIQKLKEKKQLTKPQRTIHCSDCGGLIYINDRTVSTICPFCGSNRVVVENKEEEVLNIKGVIPFQLKEDYVSTNFRKWIKKKFFAPGKFKKGVASPTYSAFYIPFYTFDSDTHTDYTALRGDYYYTTRTISTKNGTRTVTERHTRWTPVRGNFDQAFDDILIPGTNNILNKYIVQIGTSYDFAVMERYQENFLLGYVAEKPSKDLVTACEDAKTSMNNTIKNMCVSRIGGDTYSDLKYKIKFSNVTFKLIMAPIYNGNYEYKKKKYNFVCNGQSGKFAGSYPKSVVKISILVFIILALVAAIFVLLYLYN